MQLVCDKRATQQLKIYINKIFENKNAVHLNIAGLITSYSHSTIVHVGSMFEKTRNPEYFVVSRVYSPFWVRAVFLPSRVEWIPYIHPFALNNMGHLQFVPDWTKAAGFCKKKVFSPFHKPYIKKRNKRFYFKEPFFLTYN